jgi:hypothetical protein
MPSAYRKLSYPLPMKGGDILRTIQDARAYMFTLGPHRELCNHARQLLWKRPIWTPLRGNFIERCSWMENST